MRPNANWVIWLRSCKRQLHGQNRHYANNVRIYRDSLRQEKPPTPRQAEIAGRIAASESIQAWRRKEAAVWYMVSSRLLGEAQMRAYSVLIKSWAEKTDGPWVKVE